MCRVLRPFLPPALAVGRVVLSFEFHVRRSHRDHAGRAVVRRRFPHEHVGAVSPANVFRRVHHHIAGKQELHYRYSE